MFKPASCAKASVPYFRILKYPGASQGLFTHDIVKSGSVGAIRPLSLTFNFHFLFKPYVVFFHTASGYPFFSNLGKSTRSIYSFSKASQILPIILHSTILLHEAA